MIRREVLHAYLVPVKEFQVRPSEKYEFIGTFFNSDSIYVVWAFDKWDAKNKLRRHPLYWRNNGVNPHEGDQLLTPFFKFDLGEIIRNDALFDLGSFKGERLECVPTSD